MNTKARLFFVFIQLLISSLSAFTQTEISNNNELFFELLNNTKETLDKQNYKTCKLLIDSLMQLSTDEIPLQEQSLVRLYGYYAFLNDTTILTTSLSNKVTLRTEQISTAESHHHHYFLLQRKLADEKLKEKIAELNTRNEAEKKAQILASLQANYNFKLLRNLLLIIAALLFLALLFSYLFYKNFKQRLRIEETQINISQQLLQTQMNPHFIFNALSNIRSLIRRKDSEMASNSLSKFSSLMQNILSNSNQKWVGLNSELIILDDYIDLQFLRFNNSFSYEKDIDKTLNTAEIHIPPMLIQPFIENAIEHGIRSVENGKITLTIKKYKDQIYCEIDDNGVGIIGSKTKQKKSNKQSLSTKITKERLAILSYEKNKDYHLEIVDKASFSEQKGTLIKISIPFKLTAI